MGILDGLKCSLCEDKNVSSSCSFNSCFVQSSVAMQFLCFLAFNKGRMRVLHAIHTSFLSFYCNFSEVNYHLTVIQVKHLTRVACLESRHGKTIIGWPLATFLQLSITKCYSKQLLMCATREAAVCCTEWRSGRHSRYTMCLRFFSGTFVLVFLFDYFTAFVELYYMQHVILEEMMSDVYE